VELDNHYEAAYQNPSDDTIRAG